MKKIILIVVVVFLVNHSFGQIVADTTATDSNSIIVHKDHRLDLLVKKQIQINEETSRDARRNGKGFRLMVISSSNRDEVIAAKTTIYTYFPELKAYLWYQSPYYKLKAGNFKERKDAEEYQKRLKLYFPKGVFIMNDVVELKLDMANGEDTM